MIITDAWDPQVNGVVRTIKQTRAELVAMGHEVDMITRLTAFNPSHAPPILISLFPGKEVAHRIKEFAPDANPYCYRRSPRLICSCICC